MKTLFYVAIEFVALILLTTLFGIGFAVAAEEYGFVDAWGGYGYVDGRFMNPNAIAVDKEDNVYVTDETCRIQQFTPDGEFIRKWESCGLGTENPIEPDDIGIDDDGNVYVLSYDALAISDIVVQRFCNVQKFSPEGELIAKWGNAGTEDGQIFMPAGFAVDGEGNVFVVDWYADLPTFLTTYYITCRIQKFTSDGEFLSKWEASGSLMNFDMAFFISPFGGSLAVDSEDSVYVLNAVPPLVKKIITDSELSAGWAFATLEEDIAPFTSDVAIDGAGDIYVSFFIPGYVKKFTPGGELVTKWDLSLSTPIGEFGINPMAWRIAANSKGDVYHIDVFNHRVQKYAINGGNGQICFVEKLYGQHSAEVKLLRSFRDNVLMATPEGAALIKLYYEWNPQIIKALEADEAFRREVKKMIDALLPAIEGI